MNATVIVIEDEAATRDLIVGYLSRRGHRVTGCSTLAEAQQALNEQRPDVIVSDICLPDGNGATFCMNNAARLPAAKWLLMSAHTDELRQSRTLVKSPGAPPFSVFDKPVPMRALDDFIALALLGMAPARPTSSPSGNQLAT
jgi:DNA-binding NtrC family response regulator